MGSPTSVATSIWALVVNHDSGRLVWAAPGQDKATLATFFDALGPQRSDQITHVSADGAAWIATVVAQRCPNAVRCAVPFHVVKWATEALDKWVAWARRCRIPAFVKLQRSIVKYRTAILTCIEHGLSNGRIESINTRIRLITRIAFGFTSPNALIALAMLNLGGHKPALPGRN